jgi:hypothetical protein
MTNSLEGNILSAIQEIPCSHGPSILTCNKPDKITQFYIISLILILILFPSCLDISSSFNYFDENVSILKYNSTATKRTTATTTTTLII